MDDVKVHYNSDKPAQLQAHAYAQGSDIHIASGQEKHLAHEAWHVVQQKQGRVKPTLQMKGKVNVNDDTGLEKEADQMGAKAMQMKLPSSGAHLESGGSGSVVQRAWIEGAPKKWDELIDGVQWYSDDKGNLWFIAKALSPDHVFQKYSGEEHKRTYEKWDLLEINIRMEDYQAAKMKSLVKEKDKKKFRDTKDVSAVPGAAKTPVLVKDRPDPKDREGWMQVDDDLGSLPESKGNTKFINMFHLPHEGADANVDAVVMMENFREKARIFYASDAFFYQWLRVQKLSSLSDLPTTFPIFVYRNNISNEVLAEKLEKMLKGKPEKEDMMQENEYIDIEPGSEAYAEIEKTDNVKSTNIILAEFNKLNAMKKESPSRIIGIRVYKGPALRFEIRKE